MLIDVHSHVDRYSLIGKDALESALAEIVQRGVFTISKRGHILWRGMKYLSCRVTDAVGQLKRDVGLPGSFDGVHSI